MPLAGSRTGTSSRWSTARTRAYVDEVARRSAAEGIELVSIIVFGSAVTGGYRAGVSDLDIVLIVADGTDRVARRRLRRLVDGVELEHGFRHAADVPTGRLDAFARSITANVRSFFICTRSDLLSGSAARLLDIPRAQAIFVDRGVMSSFVGSAVTAWGHDLLGAVPLAPIRRADVLIALFGFWNQVLLSAALFPVVPAATRYAMAALKRSVHNCYFCYHLRPAALDAELAFFQQRFRGNATLAELALLRAAYRPSFRFVLRCLPTLLRLHVATLRDNSFPRDVHASRLQPR